MFCHCVIDDICYCYVSRIETNWCTETYVWKYEIMRNGKYHRSKMQTLVVSTKSEGIWKSPKQAKTLIVSLPRLSWWTKQSNSWDFTIDVFGYSINSIILNQFRLNQVYKRSFKRNWWFSCHQKNLSKISFTKRRQFFAVLLVAVMPIDVER